MNGLASIHQLLSMVCGDFDLTRRAKFSGMPKCSVEVRVGFQVLGLEEIRPQNQQFIFACLRLFFFDGGVAGHGVEVGRHGGSVARVGANEG